MNTLNRGHKSKFDQVWSDNEAADVDLDRSRVLETSTRKKWTLSEMTQWIP